MELSQALKIVLELAEQNMLDDSEMPDEMKQQMDAVENVRLHLQELECPSPVQVVLFMEGGIVQESASNVPVEITILDGDLEGAEDGHVRLFPSCGGDEYYVGGHTATCDPKWVAALLADAYA